MQVKVQVLIQCLDSSVWTPAGVRLESCSVLLFTERLFVSVDTHIVIIMVIVGVIGPSSPNQTRTEIFGLWRLFLLFCSQN